MPPIPNLTSYRGLIARELESTYPSAHFRFHDSAIGGTGSQLGAFRFDRDVLRHAPDLVFLDFSANDNINTDDPESQASYEAVVRRTTSSRPRPRSSRSFSPSVPTSTRAGPTE